MRHVLLVEDVEDNRKLAGDLLRFGGWEVTEAITGEEAVARAAERRFALILMDLSLPGALDGWAATRAINERAGMGAPPIVALTAHAMAGDAARALSAGFDGYITKPIEVESFLTLIEEAVGHGG